MKGGIALWPETNSKLHSDGRWSQNPVILHFNVLGKLFSHFWFRIGHVGIITVSRFLSEPLLGNPELTSD